MVNLLGFKPKNKINKKGAYTHEKDTTSCTIFFMQLLVFVTTDINSDTWYNYQLKWEWYSPSSLGDITTNKHSILIIQLECHWEYYINYKKIRIRKKKTENLVINRKKTK